MDGSCSTRYPILLVHGTGFRDLRRPVYWGRIPKTLERCGATVFYGQQDCWGSTETNAQALARRIFALTDETGCEKVHIIAHSKGGLDARAAASRYGVGDRIASLTTVCTPHRGSKTADLLLRLPEPLFRLAGFAVNHWIRLVGDVHPDFLAVCRGFSTAHMAQFNADTPDWPGVLYQSYACLMRSPGSDAAMWFASWIIGLVEGENDGLVTPESARWGQTCTVLRGEGRRGVSHLDAIDFRRAPLGGPGSLDVCRVYVELVQDLKRRGL